MDFEQISRKKKIPSGIRKTYKQNDTKNVIPNGCTMEKTGRNRLTPFPKAFV